KIWLYEHYVDACRTSAALGSMNKTASDALLRSFLRKCGIRAPMERQDHHTNHAASVFYSSGFKKCLILTADGRGDGLCASVSIGTAAGMERIAATDSHNSFGHLYGGVTEALGFGYGDGEGKTEALAAFGKETDFYHKLKKYMHVRGLALEGKIFPHQRLFSVPASRMIQGHRQEDVAYACQRLLEETFTQLARNAIRQTGIRNIAVAGGIFLNVKLNQALLDLPEVDDIYIHPAAGDTGISTGAAFVSQERDGIQSTRWRHAYLGDEATDAQIKTALRNSGLAFEKVSDIAGTVGEELLPKGHIIGWFQGRMEYGPRALGNRSVLISPLNPHSPFKVRSTIKKRPAFQPFCPSMLHEVEHRYVHNPKKVDALFMILTITAKDRMVEQAPAVVFPPDRSVRLQTVERETNPRYHALIRAFGKETGTPIVLNTSFNRSGEAIACTPAQAIANLTVGKLDYLAIGDYLVKNPEIH
ncbi:MAG TPA: carbamoyltransferase C-terminal domain-containing protein, partial [Candidatus Nanoarchaeia archaeon]|nr:carbamoyltransferase C-terminal domain-containing protein [Candidatus Nanoarchaeia archaeon]